MALFKKKDKKEESVEKQSESTKAVEVASKTEKKEVEINPNNVFAEAILRPRITEKATYMQQQNVYVFEVDSKANKQNISKAFQKIYKVDPVRINITKNPSKRVIVRGKRGEKTAVKKAYVYLKEGDNITI